MRSPVVPRRNQGTQDGIGETGEAICNRGAPGRGCTAHRNRQADTLPEAQAPAHLVLGSAIGLGVILGVLAGRLELRLRLHSEDDDHTVQVGSWRGCARDTVWPVARGYARALQPAARRHFKPQRHQVGRGNFQSRGDIRGTRSKDYRMARTQSRQYHPAALWAHSQPKRRVQHDVARVQFGTQTRAALEWNSKPHRCHLEPGRAQHDAARCGDDAASVCCRRRGPLERLAVWEDHAALATPPLARL